MRGATANSSNKASSKPLKIQTGFEDVRAGIDASVWGLESNSSSKQQTTLTQVCALNKWAAMLPAIAGVAKCANSIGTTIAPSRVKLPHQSAATNTCVRLCIDGDILAMVVMLKR